MRWKEADDLWFQAKAGPFLLDAMKSMGRWTWCVCVVDEAERLEVSSVVLASGEAKTLKAAQNAAVRAAKKILTKSLKALEAK